MSRPPIIGITGRARSGKDTVARFIIAAIGGYRYGFADPLKQMLLPLGIDFNDPYWEAHKDEPIPAIGRSPRHMLQTLGTEWGRRMINLDLWLIMALRSLSLNGPGMVIPDVRFENEVTWVRRYGGLIIHLNRDEPSGVDNSHESEQRLGIEDNDRVLHNSGDLDWLQRKVQEICHGFKA